MHADVSECMGKYAVSILLGTPPMYAGHDEGGKLTDTVCRNPYSVLLCDEMNNHALMCLASC